MDRGFVWIWRKIQDESWYAQPLTCHLAIHLIIKANHEDKKFIWNKKEIVIKRGQVLTGREKLARETGLSPQNIRTSLAILKNCDFLTIKSTTKFSIITICNYDNYQYKNIDVNQQINQQLTNKQPTTNHKQELLITNNKKDIVDPAGSTTKRGNKRKGDTDSKDTFIADVINYLNAKTGKHFKPDTPSTISLINAGRKNGFTLGDFKKVVDTKCSDWLNDPKYKKYLRPETLFKDKHFESYLNEEATIDPDSDTQDGDDEMEQNKKIIQEQMRQQDEFDKLKRS